MAHQSQTEGRKSKVPEVDSIQSSEIENDEHRGPQSCRKEGKKDP